MDQDRPLARRGNLQLLDQALTLHRVRCALVIIVEPNLSAGNHLRLGQQAVQLGQHGVVCLLRIVRINAGAGIKPRNARLPVELAANLQRPVHLRRLLANADGQHRAHARFKCALQHRRAVLRVALAIQVGMGIDQQLEAPKEEFQFG